MTKKYLRIGGNFIMTGTEAALAAKRYANAYKYIYGAKGELCSSAHIEELIAQSPTYFSDEQIGRAHV